MADERYFKRLDNISSGNTSLIDLYWMQRLDPYFQTEMNHEKLLPADSIYYMKWQENRRSYLAKKNKDSVDAFGFTSSNPNSTNIFFSLFLSANVYQFLLNVLFIFLIGALIEVKIGVIGILFGYCLTSLSMILGSVVLAPYSLQPIIASAGGVSGLIGMLLVFYKGGMVPLEYATLREVRSVNIPSMLFLPLWIISQLGLMTLSLQSTLALASQSFAMLGGMLFAIIIQLFFFQKTVVTTVNQEGNSSDYQNRLNDAMVQVSLLNYDAAKKIYYDLLNEYPTHKELYFDLFNIAKYYPSSEEYHQLVQKIFSIKTATKGTVARINLVFKNYLRYAQPTIRFDVESFLSLLQLFRKAGYYEDAEKILKVLINYDANGRLSEILAREQLLLARSYLEKNDTVQGNRLLSSLMEIFPHTESAQQVKTFAVGRTNQG
jgi:membrane associated rhomboid family serine protease